MKDHLGCRISRRQALRAAGAASLGVPSIDPLRGDEAGTPPLPEIKPGDKKVTRLIAGGNPVWGFPHATRRLSELMVNYFTPERIVEFLLHCEREGINTWQSSCRPMVKDPLLAAREKGARIQFMCLTSDRDNAAFQEILSLKPIALVHHGEDTDAAFRAGRSEKVRDFVKRIKDAGLPAGFQPQPREPEANRGRGLGERFLHGLLLQHTQVHGGGCPPPAGR
jgi:hypothetical protein